MHNFVMPQPIIDRVVKRRGKVHALERFDPAKTALLVIDLQNAFMMKGVAHTLCEMAPAIVPTVNRLAGELRHAGGLVVWIRTTATAESLASWSHLYEDLYTPDAGQKRLEALSEGSIGHAFWPELNILPHDPVITKTRYSAFLQGSSDLEAQLRARSIDTVLITGCVTNVCCESTARDAMMLNFKTIMVSDGNAASNDEEHTNSLIAFYLTFGDVLTSEQVIHRLRAGVRRPAMAQA